jgi:hypothetical protein
MNWHTPFVGTALAAILLSASSARAGFLDIHTSLTNGDTYANTDLGSLNISAPASDLSSFTIFCSVDCDPTFYITARILNNTSTPWDSYTVTITPTGSYPLTDLTASSPADFGFPDYLPNTTYDYTHNSVTFSGGLVDVGQKLTVILSFNIDSAGDTQYVTTTYAHPAVGTPYAPEPASLSLLALATPALLRRRQRRH